MDVKIVWTRQGQIMGEVEEGLNGELTIKNPMFMLPAGQNLQTMPVLGLCEETELTLQKEDYLYGKTFTPVKELRNQYSSAYGSGIQLIG